MLIFFAAFARKEEFFMAEILTQAGIGNMTSALGIFMFFIGV